MARGAFIVLDLLIASRVFEISSGADLDDTAKRVTEWVDGFIGDYKKTWTVLTNTDASVIATTILGNGVDCTAFETAIAADTNNLKDMAHTFHCAVPSGTGTIVQDSCDKWYWDVLITSTQEKLRLTLRPAIPHNQVTLPKCICNLVWLFDVSNSMYYWQSYKKWNPRICFVFVQRAHHG